MNEQELQRLVAEYEAAVAEKRRCEERILVLWSTMEALGVQMGTLKGEAMGVRVGDTVEIVERMRRDDPGTACRMRVDKLACNRGAQRLLVSGTLLKKNGEVGQRTRSVGIYANDSIRVIKRATAETAAAAAVAALATGGVADRATGETEGEKGGGA